MKETSPEDAQKVKDWLAEPGNELQAREMLGEIWADNRISLKKGDPGFDRILAKIYLRINKNKPKGTDLPVVRGHKPVPWLYRVAAVLVIPLLITSAVLLSVIVNSPGKHDLSAEREIVTKPGTRMKIQLDDGTLVWLNDGTVFRYPEKFTGGERRVFIDGEAYFKVAHNPEKPFIVENPMVNTVVTGTTFNVRGYGSDHYFEATLSEGKVRLEKGDRYVNMMPGQQVQYADDRFSYREVDPAIYSSWINGKLVLKDEPFQLAVLKLGRWYNAEFIVQDDKLRELMLTATFENERIEQTMEHMAFALPIKYQIKKEAETGKTKVFIMGK